jgi:hypothetical protein
MLNHQEFINLERKLWNEGNPLAHELASTRDELSLLIKVAREVIKTYSPLLNKHAGDDLEFMRQWDNFGDYLDNTQYALEGKVD